MLQSCAVQEFVIVCLAIGALILVGLLTLEVIVRSRLIREVERLQKLQGITDAPRVSAADLFGRESNDTTEHKDESDRPRK